MQQKTKRLVHLGMLSAISILLVYFIHMPIFPSAPFLEYDMADVPILIGAFMYGPFWGLLLTMVVSILQWLLVSPAGGWVGAVMHIFSTGSFVLVSGLLYRKFHTRKGAAVSLLAGACTMVLMMIPLNLIFIVNFYGTPLAIVQSMMLPVIVPFNAIKAFLNGGFTFLLYKPLSRVLKFERQKATKL